MTTRVAYCCNSDPKFVAPAHHKPRPPFLQRCLRQAQRKMVSLWEGFRVLPEICLKTGELLPVRQRSFNKHRSLAMQAVIECILHYLTITTGIVDCTIERIAEQCQLMTRSAAGNISITRVSRIIAFFERIGLLICHREWDPILGMWYPKIIRVTPLFFRMLRLPDEDWPAAIRQQQGYQQRGLLEQGEVQLTPEEAVKRQMACLKELYLKSRRERHEKKRARKLLEKSYEQQRHDVCASLTKSMSSSEIHGLGLDGFKKLIDERLLGLRRLVTYPPPT